MKVKLTRVYGIECGHHLNGLKPGHKCARQHGHNYRVEITIGQERDSLENGMVMDAENIDICIKPVLKRLDHRNLNDLEPAEAFVELRAQPTVENLTIYLWDALQFMSRSGRQTLERVVVYENEQLWAEIGG